MPDFKYSSVFPIEINIGPKEAFANDFDSLIASADLEKLRGILPAEDVTSKNPDLLYAAYNIAAINLVNRRDDGVMTATAKKLAPTFVNKPVNVDHNKEWVIGHTINYGFSSFDENELMDEEDIDDESFDPFNICLASVIYKGVNKYFAEDIEESANPKSYLYKKLSGSWEIKFNEYIIAAGSKCLKNAELISDDKQVEELSKYLKGYDGTGFMPDGTPLYRIVVGDCLATGVGITGNPAAAVKGMITASEDEKISRIIIDMAKNGRLDGLLLKTNTEKQPQEEKNQAVASDKDKTGVKTNTKAMKIESLEQLEANWDEFKNSDEAVASLRQFLKEQVSTQMSEAENKFNQIKNEKELRDKALEDNTAALAEAKSDLAEANKKIDELRASFEKQEKQAAFNERMASINEEYDLNDDAKAIVAKNIRDLSDEAFASWKEDFDKMYAPLKKEEKGEEKTEDNKESTEPSNEAKASDAIDGAQVPDSDIPNSQSGAEEENARLTRLSNSFKVGKGVKIGK